MAGRRIDLQTRNRFWSLLQKGYSVRAAAQEVGVSEPTAYKWTNGDTNPMGRNWREVRLERNLPEPIRRPRGDAADALKNFGLWRRRYLNRRSTPWQEEAAVSVAKWIASPETEMVVVNCPPGSGKSTLFSHDIPCWLICRDRTIRIMIGSSNLRMASKYSGRIRRTLERPRKLQGASGCLGEDYGRFRPEQADLWRRDEFIVMPYDDEPIEDKEPTVSAFGMETEFLGTRANFIIWDDLVTNKTMTNEARIESQRQWWDTEGETRVEPSGCLLLQGQRMGPNDLYSYALNQMMHDEDDEFGNPINTRYRHIIYPAHFEDRCKGQHGRDAPAWPKGCLLDPIRLPWNGSTGLATMRVNKESKYRVQYQQEDVDPENVLVQKIWIDGGKDSKGVHHDGCWDDRDLCELPHNLQRPLLSIATADPSPTKYWSVQWWIYQPNTQLRYFMDMERKSMDAPDFLDWSGTTNSYMGLVDEWQRRSIDLGYPISHWIVEDVAAQKWLLSYEFIKRWQRIHGVTIIGHKTHGSNKLDPDYGIQMLKNVYYYGMCRLPGQGMGRVKANPLVTEVTQYPESMTDDCLMAQWFLEYNLPKISMPTGNVKPQSRPSWMKRRGNAA